MGYQTKYTESRNKALHIIRLKGQRHKNIYLIAGKQRSRAEIAPAKPNRPKWKKQQNATEQSQSTPSVGED